MDRWCALFFFFFLNFRQRALLRYSFDKFINTLPGQGGKWESNFWTWTWWLTFTNKIIAVREYLTVTHSNVIKWNLSCSQIGYSLRIKGLNLSSYGFLMLNTKQGLIKYGQLKNLSSFFSLTRTQVLTSAKWVSK